MRKPAPRSAATAAGTTGNERRRALDRPRQVAREGRVVPPEVANLLEGDLRQFVESGSWQQQPHAAVVALARLLRFAAVGDEHQERRELVDDHHRRRRIVDPGRERP